ncbi:hypothetical protein ACFFWC_19160 [Plantactinospora siamensis]|uniref:Uncharacterized protein n=1 Tax=Plantactinospora siamensis TaxID=555372 RepID=A0ABV6P3G7_9ACTN
MMALTGWPFILLVALCAVGGVAGTVLLWNRFGRVRYLLRPAGVLLAEVLMLSTVGLVVNRSEEFYPTWAALLGTRTGPATVLRDSNDATYRDGPGGLDRRLAAQAGGHRDAALTFAWQPAGWRGWGLSAAPIVSTPPGYLRHPTWSYSAVVVVGDGSDGWPAAAERAAARRVTANGVSAVVVFAATTPATTARTLDETLPDQLGRDLRVTTHHWAIVASGPDAALAQSAAAAAATRYPSVAVAAGTHGGLASASVTRPAVLPAGVTWAAVEASLVGRHDDGVVPLPSTDADALYTALSWAIGRTPPPLAAPAARLAAAQRGPGRPMSAPLGGHAGSPSPAPATR